MPITHAIAHQLRRSSDTPAQLTLRSGELATEGEIEQLLARLRGSFLSRLSREHGSFSGEGNAALLPTRLGQLLEGGLDLTALSRDLAAALQGALDEAKVEFDAHLLFFLEQGFDQQTFTLFIARQSESLTLNEALEITTSHALDTGPSLFGIKVDLTEWRERKDYAYLTLVPPRGNPPLAEAFYRLTGFGNGIDKEKATLAFLEGVEAYTREVEPERQREVRSQVVEYCMAQEVEDVPVRLEQLARAVEGVDADAFVRIVTDHTAEHTAGDEGAQELRMDRRSLRRYVKFAGREKDLAISFSSYQLGERVHYDEQNDTLQISGLPPALRKQLLGHLKGE